MVLFRLGRGPLQESEDGSANDRVRGEHGDRPGPLPSSEGKLSGSAGSLSGGEFRSLRDRPGSAASERLQARCGGGLKPALRLASEHSQSLNGASGSLR